MKSYIYITKDGEDELEIYTEPPDKYDPEDANVFFLPSADEQYELEDIILSALTDDLKKGDCIIYEIKLKRIP